MTDYSSPMRDKIIAIYGHGVLKKSVINIRGGAGVIPSMLCGGKFRTVLEIGTYKGVGAAEISQYVDRVITIDLKNGRAERKGEVWDRHAFWASLGITNIDLVLVDDDDEKRALVAAMEFDFALIDGNHEDPAAIAADFEMVKRCGNVLFHDADRRGRPEKDRVIDFIQALPKHQVTYHDIFALWEASRG